MTCSIPANPDIVRALEENLWALWSRFGRGDGCALYEEAHALWFDTPIQTLPYNALLRFTAEHDADQRIDAIFKHYERRCVPFVWIVHPTARPLDLADRLRARGMEEAEFIPGMSINLRDLPSHGKTPDGVEIREVTDEEDFAGVLELVAWRWNIPPQAAAKLQEVTRAFEVGAPGGAVRCWIAWRDGVPIAKALLNCAAGVAGLYGVATKPEARGLGLARTLTLEAFSAARRNGYQIGVLHSTPMARSLYEKLGFRPSEPFRVFAPPDSLHM